MVARRIAAALAVVAALACAEGETRHEEGIVGRMIATGLIEIDYGGVPGGPTLEYEIDPKLLAGLRSGDHVAFTIEMKGGRFHVTQIRKQESP